MFKDILDVFKSKQFWKDICIVALSVLLSILIVHTGVYLRLNSILVCVMSILVGSFYIIKMLISDSIKYFKLTKQLSKSE